MTILNRNLKQTAVYWADASVNDKFGNRTYTAPVEISVRWETRTEKFIGIDGREDISRAVVFFGQDVDVGEFVFLGSLTDITSSIDETNPKNVDNAFEIKRFDKIPNLKATDFERKAFL